MKLLLCRNFLALALGVTVSTLSAQRLSDVKALQTLAQTRDDSDIKVMGAAGVSDEDFLKFYIPSAILSPGIEPAAVSKFNAGFGKDKVDLKFGWTLKDDHSLGVQLSGTAPEGARTLYQNDKTARDFTATLAYTNLRKQETGGIDGVYAYNRARWVNINGTIGSSKKIVFSDDVNYTEDTYATYSIMASYNWFFNGYFKDLPAQRKVLNIGIGYGSFDNYTSLSKYTLRNGVTGPGGTYFGETRSVAGRKGTLETKSGVLLSGAAFKPISKFDAPTNVTLGVNFNSYGAFEYVNANAGVYISGRSYDQVKEQLKENYSFGILADFSDLSNTGQEEYLAKNFRVILTAQIPIRFQD